MFRKTYENLSCDDSIDLDINVGLNLPPPVSPIMCPLRTYQSQETFSSPFDVNSLLSPTRELVHTNGDSVQQKKTRMELQPTSDGMQYQQQTERKSGDKKYKERWTTSETDVLVSQWVENYHVLKSPKTREGWIEVAAAVNEVGGKGSYRTVTDCENKIRKLVADYTKTKDKNNRTGEEPHFPRYYE